ncbi:alpha/beta hydrolase [Kaustia mangrovi]|uniref:Alpha/beta hydrolase n=1 Tax=Kaustia mangrovi TaxID=2593653 RepID=A0A7S8HBZ2_9HYPH|nr:alpha/beta hydrolase [Kaustia mangrovi]QPC43095.1 alpha/beta hydrolase [Kaustia mangrovi]
MANDVKHVAVGDTRLAYRELGSGLPIVALHGFPDTYRTWDAMSGALSDDGYRVITVAMRGYAPSDVPSNEDYSLHRLARDVTELLDQLDIDRAVILGHDWGASTAYALAAIAPERVESLIALAIPPLSVFRSGWRERWARPHNIYLRYGRISNWWLRRNNFAEVRRLYDLWSPNWDVPDNHIETVIAALMPPERSRAAVDYYRASERDANAGRIIAPIAAPALMIYGADEPEVRQECFARASNVTGPGSRTVRLDGVGHWPHLEAPDLCLTEIRSFLRATGMR